MNRLEQRRRVLFTMLTALDFRYAPGPEPPLIPALRARLAGWHGIRWGLLQSLDLSRISSYSNYP